MVAPMPTLHPDSARAAARFLDDALVEFAAVVNRAKARLAEASGLTDTDLGVPTEAECDLLDARRKRRTSPTMSDAAQPAAARPAPTKARTVSTADGLPKNPPLCPIPDDVPTKAHSAYRRGHEAGRTAATQVSGYEGRGGAAVWLDRAWTQGYFAGTKARMAGVQA